jgi:hypothetical protein
MSRRALAITSPVDAVDRDRRRRVPNVAVDRDLALLVDLIAPAPATQHLPQPRATTAAWLVMPPVLVRMPDGECMPSTSSGLVSLADQDHLLAGGSARRLRRR